MILQSECPPKSLVARRLISGEIPDLNLPIADMLPANYVQSDAVRLEIYGRIARCNNEEDLEDLEDETARRFGRLPSAARDFFGRPGSGSNANDAAS
jgi:transcription-repair coupling factor (superfamily II helicase)